MPRITAKWRKKAEVYRFFATTKGWAGIQGRMDFSEPAAVDMFEWESTGKCSSGANLDGDAIFSTGMINGYAFGKRWMNWHITEWKQSIAEGLLSPEELIDDPVHAPIRDFIKKALEVK